VEIPANTKATVYIPVKDGNKVVEGGQPLSSQKDIKVAGTDKGVTTLEVGSGQYHFVVGS